MDHVVTLGLAAAGILAMYILYRAYKGFSSDSKKPKGSAGGKKDAESKQQH
jgi:hypothetical protein